MFSSRDIPLLVIGHGDSAVVADIIRYCRGQNIQSVLVDVPAALLLPSDGHFNARGNSQIAKLIRMELGPTP